MAAKISPICLQMIESTLRAEDAETHCPNETYLAWPERSGFENRCSFLHADEYTDPALDKPMRCDLN